MTKKNKNVELAQATTKEYERLGKALESVFASEFVSRSKLYWVSFTRGLFLGLGIALGSTFVLAFVLWMLSQFSDIPIVGELADTIRRSISE